MKIKYLSDDFSTADQLQPSDVILLAEQGIRAVINNLPDRETEDQPNGSVIEQEAKRLGSLTAF
ncbi:MAG: hypothetical protein ACJAVI_004299 [Candidatus Azotimanducaceae bacterium]|jgi:uncharacterized protein (TIGR01244 family)